MVVGLAADAGVSLQSRALRQETWSLAERGEGMYTASSIVLFLEMHKRM